LLDAAVTLSRIRYAFCAIPIAAFSRAQLHRFIFLPPQLCTAKGLSFSSLLRTGKGFFMGNYRFDLVDMTGGVSQSLFHNCADDLDALDRAETLCGKSAIDVWDVLHLKRENAMATPSDGLPG
jgi:hypothetical protein